MQLEEVTNDFNKLANGEQLEKLYYKGKRLAENYSYKSPFSMYDNGKSIVSPPRLKENAQQLEYISRELQNEEKFKDPYGTEFKKLLYDMYSNDYIAAGAVDIKVDTAFASPVQPELMPMGFKVYDSEEELQKALGKTGYTETDRTKLLQFIEDVDRITGMLYYKQDIAKQYMVGGRAALFVETFEADNTFGFPEGTPAVLKPLHWSYLNQVRVDTATWKFKSVRYTDFETQDEPLNFIPANKLIYITRNDHHMSPNHLWYGLSDYHSIWKISNIIRQCEEVDIPEIVTSMWAQAGYFKFNNMNIDEMDTFMGNLGPGLYRGFNNRVEFVPVPLKHDGWFIMTLLQNMISHMLMKLRVPEFMFSFDKATSRSSVEIQMNVFRDIAIAAERRMLDRFLGEQWYSYLIALWTKQNKPEMFDNDVDFMDIRKQKIRLEPRYKPITFEDILAKANSIELLLRRYVITRYEARQMNNLPPHNSVLDEAVNGLGQLLDLSPVEKIQQKEKEKMQQQFQSQGPPQFQAQSATNNFGQKGFTRTAPQRTNAAPIGTVGAGRGNKT